MNVVKPFFIRFAILDMSKHIIYDFYNNVLKNTFDNVELLEQDTDSLIVQLSDKGTTFTGCVTCTNHSISQNWITRTISMGNL